MCLTLHSACMAGQFWRAKQCPHRLKQHAQGATLANLVYELRPCENAQHFCAHKHQHTQATELAIAILCCNSESVMASLFFAYYIPY